MPVAMEMALQKEAQKKFGTTASKQAKAYIYGTIQKAGMMPQRKAWRPQKYAAPR